MKKCPECGSEMVCHVFKGRAYYLCERCNREMIISEIAALP